MRYWNHCARPVAKQYTQRTQNYYPGISSARPEDSSEFLAAFERRNFDGMRNARDRDVMMTNNATFLLTEATYNHDGEMVKFLLDLGADPNREAFVTAMNMGNSEIAEILANRGANIREGDLVAAARNGYAGIVEFLLNQGLNINERGGLLNYTPLEAAVDKGHTSVVTILLQRGANVRVTYREGITVLMKAAMEGYTDIVDILFDINGIDIDQKDQLGLTALSRAILYGKVDVIDRLLAKGADTSITNLQGQSMLQLAARSNNAGLDIIDRILIHPGFGINYQDNEGRTALMSAATRFEDIAAIINRLVDVGADVNLADAQGKTALMIAAAVGNIEAVKALLQRGADPHRTDAQGKTALQLMEVGFSAREMAKILREAMKSTPKLSYFESCYC